MRGEISQAIPAESPSRIPEGLPIEISAEIPSRNSSMNVWRNLGRSSLRNLSQRSCRNFGRRSWRNSKRTFQKISSAISLRIPLGMLVEVLPISPPRISTLFPSGIPQGGPLKVLLGISAQISLRIC